MSNPRRTLLVHLWAQTALWLAIAVLVAHIGSAVFGRFDLTRDRKFSLSPTSREVVSSLDRPLVAKVYFTKGLEAPYHNHERALNDKLEELRAWSNGQLEIRRVDPTGDRDLTSEAQRFGIRPVTYTFRDWGREEARTVFMGVSFVYGDRQQAVDALPSVDQMEYELVRAIRTVTTEPDDRKVVGVLTGHGEPDLFNHPPKHPLGALTSQLRQRYEVRSISLEEGAIAEDVDALLVVGPQQSVGAYDQLQLDQFAMRGGAIGWFISGIQPDFRTLLAKQIDHDLHPLLAHYGVTLGRDALLDRKRNEVMVVPVNIGAQQRMARTNYPLALVSTSLNREHHSVRSLKRVVAPFSTSLRVVEPLPDTVQHTYWAETLPTAVSTRNLRQLRPNALAKPHPDEQAGPFPLAVALAGRFPSYFAGRDLPDPPEGVDPPDASEVVAESEPTRMVVVSSGDFVANNVDFVLNGVDWLLEDTSLIGIRTRNTGYDPLERPEPAQALRWKAGIALGPFGVLVLLGLATSVLTRRRP